MIVADINIWLLDNVGIGFAVFLLTLVLAAIIGGVLGMATAYPALRLRGDYLAITLLAFGESIRIIGNNFPPLVGGTLGVQVPDPLAFLPDEARFPTASILLLVMAVIAYIYCEFTIRSPLGRSLRAIRDNEVAAASLGKDVNRVRMKTIIVASALAAIAGALYAIYVGSTIAVAYDRASWTFWPFLMILIGGLANNKGRAGGHAAVRDAAQGDNLLQGLLPGVRALRRGLAGTLLLLGGILLVVLMFRPQGVIVEKPTHTLGGRSKARGVVRVFNLLFR